MPGTIQVSGFDSSSSSSPLLLKLSMGKKEYETRNKEDFSFPLTSLRHDLIITIQDAIGNQISQTVVGTWLVVEKGVSEETLFLEGGGNVHLKMQFVLSDDERQKIRAMRESALNKKQSELSKSIENSGAASATPDAASFLQIVVSDKKERNASVHIVDDYQSKQKKTQSPIADSSTSEPAISLNRKAEPLKRLEDSSSKFKKRGSLDKSRSNVKKMISAFETSLTQEKKPVTIPSSTKSEPRKIGKDSIVESSSINTQTKGEQTDLRKNFIDVKTEASEDSKAASKFEKAAFSGRMLDKDSESNRPWPYFLNKRRSSKNSFTKERKLVQSKDIMQIEEALVQSKDVKQNEDASDKVRTDAVWNAERFPLESANLWVFPDERKHLCITSGSKKVMNLFGGVCTETNVSSYKPEDEKEVSPVVLSEEQDTEKVESSADFGGPFGQVVRIAIMVGFGALVFLTRKRK